jgi:hypothetical protein
LGKEVGNRPKAQFITGIVTIAGESDVIRTSTPIDDALRMVLSGGKASLQELAHRVAAQN